MADMLRAGWWQANDEIPHATVNVPTSDENAGFRPGRSLKLWKVAGVVERN